MQWKSEGGLLCTNRSAQWPVTAMQLTAVLQGGSREHEISTSHENNPHAHLEGPFSAGPRQFAAQLDRPGGMELNLLASAFHTEGINHLWQPHTRMGIYGENVLSFSCFVCAMRESPTSYGDRGNIFYTASIVLTENLRRRSTNLLCNQSRRKGCGCNPPESFLNVRPMCSNQLCENPRLLPA